MYRRVRPVNSPLRAGPFTPGQVVACFGAGGPLLKFYLFPRGAGGRLQAGWVKCMVLYMLTQVYTHLMTGLVGSLCTCAAFSHREEGPGGAAAHTRHPCPSVHTRYRGAICPPMFAPVA